MHIPTFLLNTFLTSMALAIPHPSPPGPLAPISWSVYLSPALPVITTLTQNYTFSQTAITLLSGHSSAILIDCPPTYNSTTALANWLDTQLAGRKLTHIYVTHGHGDHFFGIPVLQARFPGLEVVATPAVIAHAKQQLEDAQFEHFWKVLFPNGQVPPQTETWNALPVDNSLSLEGHVLKAVEVGFTDTYNTTVLHVPDLELVVAGDVVYGAYHQYLVESHTPELRAEWVRALGAVEALSPKWVIPSHKQAWDGFGVGHIERTRSYLQAWGMEVVDVKGKEALKGRMESAFPERKGDYILDVAAGAAYPSK